MKRFAVIGMLAAVMGCTTTCWWGNRQTTLNLGMSKQQAQSLLGLPQQASSQQIGDAMIDIWKYMDRTLTFRNGILQGWIGVDGPSATSNSTP